MKGRSTTESMNQAKNLTPDDLWRIMEDNVDRTALQQAGGVQGIANSLQSDLKKGIDPASVSLRISKYGTNVLPDRDIPTFWELFVEALKDDTLIILIICAILSLVLEMIFASPEERSTAWVDGVAILVAVAIVSIVQAYSNHNQEIQFAAVNHIKSIFDVAVIRSGKTIRIQNTDLVVGDVVLIEQGDCVPADGVLIDGEDLHIDQSTSDGESVAKEKDTETDPFLVSNTHVTDGRGLFLVLCVGLNSHQGKIFNLISNDEKQQTPLQEKLDVLAQQIGYMGMVAAALTFAALTIQWIIRNTKNGWHWKCVNDMLSYLVIAISIVVVAVPEGLPLAVTISLAFSMRQMMTDNNFVRRLSACETMGSVTVICTDKTGTLTMNEMNVEHVIVANDVYDIPTFNQAVETSGSLLMRSIALNTHAVLESEIGSQTELALLRFLRSEHIDYSLIRTSAEITKHFLFDRNRKRESVVEKIPPGFQVFTKGAFESIIPLCTSYSTANNEIVPVTPDFVTALTATVERECSSAYRTLAIATRQLADVPHTIEDAENDMTLLAVFSIRDSLRPNSAKSIADCQRAGIRAVIVTGDHMLTAQAIAKDCNITQPNSICLTGKELREMSESQLESILPRLAIVARSTPMDKHKLVRAFQQTGNVVGVTGDGTNDVAAFMAADVGLSMGKSGTELAKEASDIVILDDDFRSIVRSVVWGRSVYNNIRRFLQFQLTANVVSLFISFISAAFLGDTPFKAVQLLWVNLIMDSFGALALATGKPHDELLNQPPQPREASLISSFMIKNIASQSLLQIGLIIFLFIFPGKMEPNSVYHYTFVFTVFVLCQMFNLVNARAVEPRDSVTRGMFDSWLYFGIFGVIGLVQVLLVQVAGPFFSCAPMSFNDWVRAIGLSALSLPIGFIVRHLAATKKRHAFMNSVHA